ncbi:hypothetical protein UCREL1_1988 [Eutypa lata UCREL1]|uniref:Uncharacterized protein n=1 Tax=Eutypa lata (strain UCR-EL1) TaxID=1287681 RepID=M7SWJ0_EUTLA|nr:hypothetical protein UCREL1_1988 [Eutypa lata UCREL1]
MVPTVIPIPTLTPIRHHSVTLDAPIDRTVTSILSLLVEVVCTIMTITTTTVIVMTMTMITNMITTTLTPRTISTHKPNSVTYRNIARTPSYLYNAEKPVLLR